jgi:hypothetical protein
MRTHLASYETSQPKALHVWPRQAVPLWEPPVDDRRGVEPEDEGQRDVAVVFLAVRAQYLEYSIKERKIMDNIYMS